MRTDDQARVPPSWLIFLAVFVYTSLFGLGLIDPGNSRKGDSAGYVKLAQNLRTYHVFSSDEGIPRTPELFRIPGYPFFLAVLGATSPSCIQWAIGIQCLLGFLLLFLVWPFCYRLGGLFGAYVGTIFLCFDLVALLHQNLILTEALFTFVLTGGLCLSMRYFDEPTVRRGWPAGVAFGIAALIKPLALFVAGTWVLVCIRNWKNALWIALFTLGLPLLWVLRNWTLTGHPVYTVQGGLALIEYPATRVLASATGLSNSKAGDVIEALLRKNGIDGIQDPVAKNKLYSKVATDIMKEHPLATLNYCITGGVRILGGTGLDMMLDMVQWSKPSKPHFESDLSHAGTGTLSVLRLHPALLLVQIPYLIFLLAGYTLFSRGVWKLFRNGQCSLAAFLLGSVVVILLVSCHQGYYRFRIPLLPFLAFGMAASFKPRTISETV